MGQVVVAEGAAAASAAAAEAVVVGGTADHADAAAEAAADVAADVAAAASGVSLADGGTVLADDAPAVPGETGLDIVAGAPVAGIVAVSVLPAQAAAALVVDVDAGEGFGRFGCAPPPGHPPLSSFQASPC